MFQLSITYHIFNISTIWYLWYFICISRTNCNIRACAEL